MKAFFLHALPSRFKTMMWQYFWNHDVWIRMNWKNYTDFGTPFSPLVSSDQGAYSSDMSGWTLDSTQDDLCPSYKSTGNFWLGRQWQFHLWHIGTISFLVNKLAKKRAENLARKIILGMFATTFATIWRVPNQPEFHNVKCKSPIFGHLKMGTFGKSAHF